ncbi:MAG: response regulator transcription factor [Chloroflexota bacterium]|nr:response regulator transcription factor [Chloroflexota bacterium]
MNETILVIEHNQQTRQGIEQSLRQAGYRVLSAGDGISGLALIRQSRPSLLVLDLMLPGLDGWEIIRRLRRNSDPLLSVIYIIVVTTSAAERERATGLEVGADDSLIKPFSASELVTRVQSALRRLDAQSGATAVEILKAGALRLNPTYRTVMLGVEPVELTITEFELLHYFMRHPGRLWTRNDLLTAIEDSAYDLATSERAIDVHIKKLRQKLGSTGRQSRFIETVHGVGYRFVGQEE